jgi:hypothetical protein
LDHLVRSCYTAPPFEIIDELSYPPTIDQDGRVISESSSIDDYVGFVHPCAVLVLYGDASWRDAKGTLRIRIATCCFFKVQIGKGMSLSIAKDLSLVPNKARRLSSRLKTNVPLCMHMLHNACVHEVYMIVISNNMIAIPH